MAENEAPELKPCPWCKATPEVLSGAGYNFTVECLNENCPVSPATVGIRGRANAIKTWNSRADLAAPDAQENEVTVHWGYLVADICNLAKPNSPQRERAALLKQSLERIARLKQLTASDVIRQAQRETWDAAIGRVKNLWTTTRGNEFNGALNQAVSALEAAALRAEDEKGTDAEKT